MMINMSLLSQPNAEVSYKMSVFLVLLGGLFWSTMGLGIRLIDAANVWQILLYRSISLSVFLSIIIFVRSGENPFRLVGQLGLPVYIGGLSLVAAYAGGIYSVQATSVASAMLLFATAPFWAALLGWLIMREPVRKATIITAFFALIGIGIMVMGQNQGTALAGNVAALFSALGFAVFTVTLRMGKSRDMLPAVFLSGVFAIVITSVICLMLGLSYVLSVSDGTIAAGMGVFQVGAGLVCYTIGSKVLPASELTLLSLLEVVLGPVWVYLLLGEQVSSNTVIGGTVLLMAILANGISGARRKPPAITSP